MNTTNTAFHQDQAIDTAEAEEVVRVQGLVKHYGPNEAVGGIDLDVRKGEIFAFLGPNGAGKTTTIEISSAAGRRGGVQVGVLTHRIEHYRRDARPASRREVPCLVATGHRTHLDGGDIAAPPREPRLQATEGPRAEHDVDSDQGS